MSSNANFEVEERSSEGDVYQHLVQSFDKLLNKWSPHRFVPTHGSISRNGGVFGIAGEFRAYTLDELKTHLAKPGDKLSVVHAGGQPFTIRRI